jgi:YHS domain-containing protein
MLVSHIFQSLIRLFKMLKNIRNTLLIILCALGLWSNSASAKEAQIYTGLFNKVAVSGYDPVAYFTEKKPVKGDAKFTTNYKNAQWNFSSAENRDKFVAAPERYAPQYGGYCAWAVSQGSTASGDPQFWKIVNDKLYLNFDAQVQKKWEANIPSFIQQADSNWPKVLDN